MNFVLERVTQPSIEPVTLAEAIQHLREFSSISQATQDQLTALIVAGREWAEDYTGRALIEQRWRLTVGSGSLPFAYTDSNTVSGIYAGVFDPRTDGILLRKSPVIALVSVASVDSLGVETALDVADYEVMEADSKWPRVVASWSGSTLRFVYRAGFAAGVGSPDPTPDAALVPERFKQAIKLWVEAMYDRDEKLMPMLLIAAEMLLKPERAELQLA